MAEIRRENIVLDVQLKADQLEQSADSASNKIESLESKTVKSNDNIQKAFNQSGDAAKVYANELAKLTGQQRSLQSESVKLSDELNDVNRALREQQKALDDTSKVNLNKQKQLRESIAALKDQKFEIQEQIKLNRLNQREVRQEITVNNRKIRSVNSMNRSYIQLARSTFLYNTRLGGVINSMINFIQRSEQTDAATGRLTKRMNLLRLAKFGIAGAAVAAGAAIVTIALASDQARSQMKIFADTGKAAFATLKTGLNVFGTELIAGNGLIESYRKAFGNFVEDVNEYRLILLEIREAQFNLRTFDRSQLETAARLTKQMREQQRILEDDTTSVAEKLAATRRLAVLQREEIELRREGLNLQERAAFAELDKATSTADKEKQLNLLAKIAATRVSLRQDEDEVKFRETQTIRGLTKEKDKREEIVGILNKKREAIKKLGEQIDKSENLQDIVRLLKERLVAEKELLDLESALNARSQETTTTQKIQSGQFLETTRSVDQLRSELAKLEAQYAKLGNQQSKFGKQMATVIQSLKDEISTFSPEFVKLGEKLEKQNEKRVETILAQREADAKARKDIKEGAAELVAISAAITSAFARDETDRLDAQVKAQEQRVQRFQILAEQGATNQLALEEERLNKLYQLREQAAQRERQLAALEITAANAVSVAKAIQAVISGFKDGNFLTGIANSIALAATIGATILAVKNATASIPAFFEGTEYLQRNGAPKGKDKILVRANEGERIVPTKENRLLTGISNKDLPYYANLGKALQVTQLATIQKTDNYDAIVHELQGVKNQIRKIKQTVYVDRYGIKAGLDATDREQKRRRNLAR